MFDPEETPIEPQADELPPEQAPPTAGSIIIDCPEESQAYVGDHPLAGLYVRGAVLDIPGDVSSEVAAGLIAAGIAVHVI